MDDREKSITRDFIARNYPEHLNGNDQGWLHFEEINYHGHKFIHIYSKENKKKEIIGTVII